MIEGEIKKEANRFILKSGREKYNLDRFPQITDEDIGEFVEFELTHNNMYIYSITFSNGNVMKQQNPNPPYGNTPRQHYNNGQPNNDEKAIAPYNFISLNDSIVPSEFSLKKSNTKTTGLNEISFDKWHTSLNEKEILNGYVDYEITNLTDLFIGNKPNKTETKDNKTKELQRNFFTIGKNGEPAVSGSSFRGLVKNMICISSYSQLSQLENEKLFYRNINNRNYSNKFIDRNKLNKPLVDSAELSLIQKKKDAINTNNKLNQFEKSDLLQKIEAGKNNPDVISYNKIFAGYLSKETDKYYIKPCRKINGLSYYRVNGKAVLNDKKEITHFQLPNKKYPEFREDDIFFKPVNEKLHLHFRIDKKQKVIPYYIKYALIENIKDQPDNEYIKGKLVISGGIGSVKHLHWILNEADNDVQKFMDVSHLIDKYKKDENREIENFDILNRIDKNNEVPVFYILNENSEIDFFGHTALFRLEFEKSIKDHLPEVHKDTNKLDITEALFGMTTGKTGTEIFASRLHFMDAERIHTPENAEYPNFQQPKILSSPKPTAYKLYLENGNDWNSNDKLRGYKLYHHKNADWIFKPTEKEKIPDSYPPRIKPLKPGNRFKGRIYFDNLTEVELGAILFVLKLKSDLCLKIGMGKPYGMGSINVENIQLTTIDRKERYKSIFSEDKTSFNLSEKQSDAKLIEELIKKYEAYILENIESSKTSLWDECRMQELEKMLDIKNADKENWSDKTRYLTLENNDKKRWREKLPYILDII